MEDAYQVGSNCQALSSKSSHYLTMASRPDRASGGVTIRAVGDWSGAVVPSIFRWCRSSHSTAIRCARVSPRQSAQYAARESAPARAAGRWQARLALWIAQSLVCLSPGRDAAPAVAARRTCDVARHPDVHWLFPRQRLNRARRTGRHERFRRRDRRARVLPGCTLRRRGSTASTWRSRHRADGELSPAMASGRCRIGDADQMVSQEGRMKPPMRSSSSWRSRRRTTIV